MARSKAIPDALGMRALKYAPESTPAQRDAVAAALRAAGRVPEALLLYEGRTDHPALRDDLRTAVGAGSSFVLKALDRMGVPVTAADWAACGDAAEAAGRWYDALRCREATKDDVGLARVRERLPGYTVAVPANKV